MSTPDPRFAAAPSPSSPAPPPTLNPQLSTSVSLEGFPQDEETRAALYWLGDDYARTVAARLSKQLAADDPAGVMLALRCLRPPRLDVEAAEDDGRVLAVKADFEVEALMQSGDGSRWNLRITLGYDASHLDRDDGGHIQSDAAVEDVAPA